ncbi:MAG: hypothetical protein M3443_14590, partial [Actinomycetota bacterium]|nr:hypothetical protein [Actinomycetota bacterium]
DALTRERVAWLMLNPSVPAWERSRVDPNGGVLSHATAAYVNRWGDLPADTITLSVPRRRVSRYEDTRYLVRNLDQDDVVLVEGLPATTAERTVADLLTEHVDGGHVGQIIYDAVRRDQLDVDALAARIGHLARHYGVPRRDGRALIDHLLEQGGHLATELAKPRLARPAESAGVPSTQITQGFFNSVGPQLFPETPSATSPALHDMMRNLARQHPVAATALFAVTPVVDQRPWSIFRALTADGSPVAGAGVLGIAGRGRDDVAAVSGDQDDDEDPST